MLSTVKKDKKRRALVKKFEIKNLYAKTFQQDLLLKEDLKKDNYKIPSLSIAKHSKDSKRASKLFLFSKLKSTLYSFLYEKAIRPIPQNSSKARVKNRCIKSGRSRAVLKFCKLSRIVLREQASKGVIPGVSKASW